MATFHFTTYDRSYGRQFFVSKKEALKFYGNAPCDESGRELRQGNYHLDGEFYYSSGKEFTVLSKIDLDELPTEADMAYLRGEY